MKLFPFMVLALSLIACSKDNDPAPSPTPVDTLATGWKKVPVATQARFTDIFFINNTTGYAIAGPSVFRSTDGGNNWQKVYGSAQNLDNIAMGSTTNTIFTTKDKTLLLTKDGGNTFDSVTLADNAIRDVFFINATVAYAAGDKTWKTTDAGKNWTPLSTFSVNTPLSSKFLYFLNEQTGWVTGDQFFKTTNGGISWESTPGVTFGYTMGTISFPDANTGYVTDAYSINKTTNGGASYTKIFTPYSTYFHDIHFINPQIGYVTDNFYILKTIDGGQTWTKDVVIIPGSLGGDIVELHFTDASHGWAAGSGGYILKYEK